MARVLWRVGIVSWLVGTTSACCGGEGWKHTAVGDLEVGDLVVGDLVVGDLAVGDLAVGDLAAACLSIRGECPLFLFFFTPPVVEIRRGVGAFLVSRKERKEDMRDMAGLEGV
jgi:hypothetical protein